MKGLDWFTRPRSVCFQRRINTIGLIAASIGLAVGLVNMATGHFARGAFQTCLFTALIDVTLQLRPPHQPK